VVAGDEGRGFWVLTLGSAACPMGSHGFAAAACPAGAQAFAKYCGEFPGSVILLLVSREQCFGPLGVEGLGFRCLTISGGIAAVVRLL
jgi:hypothetical protein